jgi:medium-chain acyl-[acyl-carrier-protein] hydrolase
MNYSFNSRVRYSETGEDGRLTLPGVLNYFQDCCTFHAESIGLGGDVLKARNRAWVLSSWQVVVGEYAKMGKEIKITTIPYEFKGFMGMRNFIIQDSEGRKLAWANSNWTHLDISTGLPARLTPADTDNYVLGEKMEMDYAPRKIALPKEREVQNAFSVQKHHLDTNHHVNNCQYIRMAADHLPEDFKVGQLRVEYKRQAVLDNVIIPEVYMTENKEAVVLNAEDKEPYAVVEFTK